MKRWFVVGFVASIGLGTWVASGSPLVEAALCAITGSSATLTPNDFAYVGSFKLQDRAPGTDFNADPGLGSSWGAITTRTDSGNGLTLLITAWIRGSSRVFEYQVPNPGSLTSDLTTTATAPLLRQYSNIFNNLNCNQLVPGGCSGIYVMGLGYVGNSFGNGHELMAHYRDPYYVNGWDPSVVSVTLNTDETPFGGGGFASSTTAGPWCGTEVPMAGRDAYSLTVPPGLASMIPGITGKLLLGGDAYQVGPDYGMGPNLVAVDHPRQTTRDTPAQTGASANCSLRNVTTLINHDAAHPAPRNDNAYLGISCQDCGYLDASGRSVSLYDTAAMRSSGGPPYRGSRFYPTWNSLNPDGSRTQPNHGTDFLVNDRTLSAVVIETPGGKSAVLFAAQLTDTLPGYPYPNPLGLPNPMSELFYGQKFTFDGSWGTFWEATGFGVTTVAGHLIAYSESDIARVASGAARPYSLTPAWDVRKTDLGGYAPRGSNRSISGPGVDVTLDQFPDLILGGYQFKMAYDPGSQLLFISRPMSWAYSPYEIVPTIDVWRVTAR